MSGAGRKSAYRKGVTKKVLYGDPEPKENEQIVRVVALRGSNLFEVRQADGTMAVTMLPTRFRKLIWVKRGDYLIVSAGEGGEITTSDGKKGAVTSIVESILYKDQIKSLRAKGLWCVSPRCGRTGERRLSCWCMLCLGPRIWTTRWAKTTEATATQQQRTTRASRQKRSRRLSAASRWARPMISL
jgi:translation initiation factor IF-1